MLLSVRRPRWKASPRGRGCGTFLSAATISCYRRPNREPYSNGYVDRDGNDSYPKSVLSGEWHNDDTAGIYVEDRDAAFIAASRELVPELVAEVERLRRHRCNPPGGIDLLEIS